MINYMTVTETRDALNNIGKAWDPDSEDYLALASGMVYLEEYAQFLQYIYENDDAGLYGRFMIDASLGTMEFLKTESPDKDNDQKA